MSNLQFYHANRQHFKLQQVKSYTAVCDVPTVLQVLGTINESINKETPTVSIAAGVTMVSSKDQYCRKTGREFAISSMRSRPFRLNDLVFDEDKITATFECLDENSDISWLCIELKKGRKRAYFVAIGLKE